MSTKTGSSDQSNLEKSKAQVQNQAYNLFKALKRFILSLVSVKSEIDFVHSKTKVEENIKFQGFNVWVLICSIFIASVGLNSNSTAVVIGAMLISPLMGPIVGVGFSLGTYRFELLRRSLNNFLIMILVSLLTSTLYFIITPLDKADTEILARTTPTLLDVIVAIFGGVAGAIEATKKENSLTVIPGVAIATALMPPLCTAGFGIATLQLDFVVGAMYLFLLNSVIISISTTVFVRVIGFKTHDFIDQKREKRVKAFIIIFTVFLIVPSVFFLVRISKKSLFEKNVAQFINNEISYEKTFLISSKMDFMYNDTSKVEILLGGKTVPDSVVKQWGELMNEYKIYNTKLIIIQDIHDELLSSKLSQLEEKSYKTQESSKASMNALILENAFKLKQKDSLINGIEEGMILIDSIYKTFPEISKEIYSLYSSIEKTSVGRVLEDSSGVLDTIPVIYIKWKKNTPYSVQRRELNSLDTWVKLRAKNPKIRVRRY